MVPFFVQIKCQLGKSYEVANRLADAEIASEIYSTAGEFDLLIKGAYTQSWLRQLIFGGATRHILANATLPVLMAH